MFMFDMSADLSSFYHGHIRLGGDLRTNLAAKRDLNLDRLNAGLDALATETGKPHPHWCDWRNQGGYAMHTLNKDPSDESDYDIDVAVIFKKSEICVDPLQARKRVRDALAKKCVNFTTEPEARTNVVTIYYADGYHIDFAVYRTYVDDAGVTHTEHASREWTERDPAKVTNWFQSAADRLSPKENSWLGYKPAVAPGQFRRIVRFTKWFCRSRSGWTLPGGMVVSALLEEAGVYKANDNRDDRALYDTLVALRDRLKVNCQVFSPVDGSELTGRTEVLNQVKRLRDRLDENLPKLDILFDQGACTREKARSAWDWIFNHDFWAKKETAQKSLVEARAIALPYFVEVTCGLAKTHGGLVYRYYTSGKGFLPKDLHLRFDMVRTNVPPPYDITWHCTNEGDEAAEAEQIGWQQSGPEIWTSTAFSGVHRLTCRISANQRVLAETSHVVRIARGLRGIRGLLR
ncbi:hypothetical protein IBL26_09600 [Roseomonas aerophila]|uniref:Cyclic GMP-AMP synthase n=1 Tax=Teichococcus aerophilus TaxID=1224513 RepID=A0ABR7RL98_9PROT|nr:hypothetical protein [Pseudoroseomonas aerophila]MBC9207086.1 hypothetical protein [Pseudoroseomonas aerophila]